MKKIKGITLISLVITIIILIILAGVSINLMLGENGMFNKAKHAKEQQKMAEVQEKIEIAIIDIQADRISKGEQCTVDTIISELPGKIDGLTISKDGENGKGTYNGCDFNISSNLKTTIDGYNSTISNEEQNTTTSILKAGDYIKYNTGVTSVGKSGIITCRVLYDVNSKYGLQIVSDKSVEKVTLGGEDWTTARDSYNNAIETLNGVADKYLNKTYATDVRCVGSIPTLQNGKFIDENSENEELVKLGFTTKIEGANNMKGEDKNYETDQTQMTKLNIWTTGEQYWLTSRGVNWNSSYCYFDLRYVHISGALYRDDLCGIIVEGTSSSDLLTNGLRIVVALKTNIKIIGGDGTSEETAYTM